MKKQPHCGVGINDADYVVEQIVNGEKTVCPFYKRWRDMIVRCYSPNYHKRTPSYIECSVCKEWLTFSNFKRWMEKQDWKNKALDKDIIKPGNKVYSPEFCAFISPNVNNLLTDRRRCRGKFPVGVGWSKKNKSFQAKCSVDGKVTYLGNYKTPEAAYSAYRQFKANVILDKAREQSDLRIASGLIAHAQRFIKEPPNRVAAAQ
jgi:hypothetical protein